jgi:excisionase family DNA binding protein
MKRKPPTNAEPNTPLVAVKRRLLLPLEQRLCCTPREAADMLGISYIKILDLANRGTLPHARLGKRLVFRKDALLRWLEREFEKSVIERATEPPLVLVGGNGS